MRFYEIGGLIRGGLIWGVMRRGMGRGGLVMGFVYYHGACRINPTTIQRHLYDESHRCTNIIV